jgi:hypothetical protein
MAHKSLLGVRSGHAPARIASGDVILTVLARQRQPAAPVSIITPDALRLKIEPLADCGRYDSIETGNESWRFKNRA